MTDVIKMNFFHFDKNRLEADTVNRIRGWCSLTLAVLVGNRFTGTMAINFTLCCLYMFCEEMYTKFKSNDHHTLIILHEMCVNLRVHLTTGINQLVVFFFENSSRSIYAIHYCAYAHDEPDWKEKERKVPSSRLSTFYLA